MVSEGWNGLSQILCDIWTQHTFNPFLQFSGLSVYKDMDLHSLGTDWLTTRVFSKMHPFSENIHSVTTSDN